MQYLCLMELSKNSQEVINSVHRGLYLCIQSQHLCMILKTKKSFCLVFLVQSFQFMDAGIIGKMKTSCCLDSRVYIWFQELKFQIQKPVISQDYQNSSVESVTKRFSSNFILTIDWIQFKRITGLKCGVLVLSELLCFFADNSLPN